MRGVRGALRMRCALHRCGKFLDKKRTEAKNLKFEYFFGSTASAGRTCSSEFQSSLGFLFSAYHFRRVLEERRPVILGARCTQYPNLFKPERRDEL